MKIVFLSSYAHLVLDKAETRVSGGAELQVALLARELAFLGNEVVLLGGDTGQRDGIVQEGVRIRNAGKFHTGHPGQMLGAVPGIFRMLREERPEWVFVLGWTAWLFVLWLLRPLVGYRLGFICGLDTEVNGEFRRENPLRGALFEWALRRCDVRYAMTDLQARLFWESGLSCCLYRNLILPRTAPLQEAKTVDFLWVARCRAIKNPLLFLDLAESLPEAQFEMICPPEDAQLFAQVAQRAAALPHVVLRPSVPYHEIQARYDAARVFVNTSDWEGWANSFIQAGQGRAALLSWRVKPDRLFADYALGYCAEGDWQVFLQKARELWQSPSLAESCGRETERFVQELHDNKKETAAFVLGLREFQSPMSKCP